MFNNKTNQFIYIERANLTLNINNISHIDIYKNTLYIYYIHTAGDIKINNNYGRSELHFKSEKIALDCYQEILNKLPIC